MPDTPDSHEADVVPRKSVANYRLVRTQLSDNRIGHHTFETSSLEITEKDVRSNDLFEQSYTGGVPASARPSRHAYDSRERSKTVIVRALDRPTLFEFT
jgi:hypothetical protein